LASEAIARTGFDAVCLDMQHGFHDYGSLREGVTGVSAAGAAAVIRIPYGGMPDIGRMLDLGFNAVICPMINTREDALEFARAMKYPPIGRRSWGPARAIMLSGQDNNGYLRGANANTLSFAMIETRQAIDPRRRLPPHHRRHGLPRRPAREL
jgi:4-hydroxy-2-oxoheptanedioate aldolase